MVIMVQNDSKKRKHFMKGKGKPKCGPSPKYK